MFSFANSVTCVVHLQSPAASLTRDATWIRSSCACVNLMLSFANSVTCVVHLQCAAAVLYQIPNTMSYTTASTPINATTTQLMTMAAKRRFTSSIWSCDFRRYSCKRRQQMHLIPSPHGGSAICLHRLPLIDTSSYMPGKSITHVSARRQEKPHQVGLNRIREFDGRFGRLGFPTYMHPAGLPARCSLDTAGEAGSPAQPPSHQLRCLCQI